MIDRRKIRILRRSPAALGSTFCITCLVLCAVAADIIAPFHPLEQARGEEAGGHPRPPSGQHWLGTDQSGRDVLARMIHGTVVSMKVGFLSMGIAVVIGLVLGSAAGYAGGWIDIVISRFIEIVER